MANNCSKKERICIHCGSKYIPTSNRQKYCANCKSFQQSNFWRTHKEQRKELDKKRYMKNRDKILEKHKIWSKNNRERLRQYDSRYRKDRRKKDVNFKIRLWSRTNINRYLDINKTRSTFDILGYTPEQLKQRLEMNFKPDMTWENHGTLWHIDHRKPLCKFNLTLPDGTPNYEQIRLANSLANLQPLYVTENLSKGGK